MTYLQAFILAIVEGITEFLPVSSTGHLILTSHLMHISQTDFVKTFEIAVQFGAILAVFFLYGKKLIVEWEIMKKTAGVFITTGFLGFVLYSFIKEYLLGNTIITALSFFIGGLLIIAIERYFKGHEPKGEIKNLPLGKALLLGIIQILSVIPGVSRSATTIFGGMFLGLSRKEATELSFYVAIPVMASATGYDLLKNVDTFSKADLGILVFGVVFSFISAILAIRWLLGYVKTHDFTYFGIYRIIVALIFFLFMY